MPGVLQTNPVHWTGFVSFSLCGLLENPSHISHANDQYLSIRLNHKTRGPTDPGA